VMTAIERRGWDDDTDVVFTTDHGELQGDFGMLFKGPYHVDALMHVPLIWRPAPSAGVTPAVLNDLVSHVDLAPTFCDIAGLPVPNVMQGSPLPTAPGGGQQRLITEWDSIFDGIGIHMRTIYRDGYVCTAYEKSNYYDGTEGELYKLDEDPNQWRNLWEDSGFQGLRRDLLADLYDNLPPRRDPPLEQVAPV